MSVGGLMDASMEIHDEKNLFKDVISNSYKSPCFEVGVRFGPREAAGCSDLWGEFRVSWRGMIGSLIVKKNIRLVSRVPTHRITI